MPPKARIETSTPVLPKGRVGTTESSLPELSLILPSVWDAPRREPAVAAPAVLRKSLRVKSDLFLDMFDSPQAHGAERMAHSVCIAKKEDLSDLPHAL